MYKVNIQEREKEKNYVADAMAASVLLFLQGEKQSQAGREVKPTLALASNTLG